MNSLKRKSVYLLALIVFTSCFSDRDDYENVSNGIELENRLIELYDSKSQLVQPLETDYNAIPSDLNNPITEAKVTLGKLLYH